MPSAYAASFSSTTLHEDQAKLTSLTAWGESDLAVGTAEGLLLHLANPEGSHGSAAQEVFEV